MAHLSAVSASAVPKEIPTGEVDTGNAELWWIRPHTLVLFVLLPLFLLLPLLPSPPKDVKTYFGTELYLLGIALLILFSVGSWLGARGINRVRTRPASGLRIRVWLLDLFFLMSLAAYVIWFLEILLNPGLLLQAAQLGAFEVRDQVSNIPGITSFTQAGIPFFICYLVATRYCDQELGFRFHIYIAILLTLAMVRVFIWTERLALLEIVVPVLLLSIPGWRPRSRWLRRGLIAAPLFGIVALIVFFGVMEYFRSWLDFYSESGESFLDFILQRISSYYVTAVNNAVGYLVESGDWPRWDGRYTLSGIYAMPGVGEALITEFALRPDTYPSFLSNYLDEELNNFSGLYFPIVDYGLIGGSLVLGVCAFLTGYSWRLFAARSIGGLLFYPIVYVGLTELLRILYLGNPRTVIPIALLTIIYFIGFRRRASVAGVLDIWPRLQHRS